MVCLPLAIRAGSFERSRNCGNSLLGRPGEGAFGSIVLSELHDLADSLRRLRKTFTLHGYIIVCDDNGDVDNANMTKLLGERHNETERVRAPDLASGPTK